MNKLILFLIFKTSLIFWAEDNKISVDFSNEIEKAVIEEYHKVENNPNAYQSEDYDE